MNTSDIITKLEKFFLDYPDINAVILFGSFGKGLQTHRSDVDLAILFKYENVLSQLELLDLRESLSGYLEKDVDLVCLNVADPIIAMQVYKTGKIIINRNNHEVNLYFMTLISKYIEIKELRKPMEENILKRKIHG